MFRSIYQANLILRELKNKSNNVRNLRNKLIIVNKHEFILQTIPIRLSVQETVYINVSIYLNFIKPSKARFISIL